MSLSRKKPNLANVLQLSPIKQKPILMSLWLFHFLMLCTKTIKLEELIKLNRPKYAASKNELKIFVIIVLTKFYFDMTDLRL